jgi:hypothetical protein
VTKLHEELFETARVSISSMKQGLDDMAAIFEETIDHASVTFRETTHVMARNL